VYDLALTCLGFVDASHLAAMHRKRNCCQQNDMKLTAALYLIYDLQLNYFIINASTHKEFHFTEECHDGPAQGVANSKPGPKCPIPPNGPTENKLIFI
jgi:hypothetical protein